MIKNSKILQSHSQLIGRLCRKMSSSSGSTVGRGLVLGSFCTGEKTAKQLRLTQAAAKVNDSTGGRLVELINTVGPVDGSKCRVFYGLGGNLPSVVAVVGLGDPEEKFDPNEGLNPRNESTRIATAAGVRALMDLKADPIEVEDMENAQAAAEGAYLANYKFQAYKSADKQAKLPTVQLADASKAAEAEWNRGKVLADLQNFARVLMESPANLMTPTIFCERVKERAKGLPVEIQIHDEAWAREKKMGSFLSVTNGSEEPARFLEITYNGGKF